MNDNGLTQSGELVIVTGAALRPALLSALTAIKQRKRDGLPTKAYEDLACAYGAAMAASGQTDVRLPAISDPVPMQPTVPLTEAATRLGVSDRQARRLADKIGGQKIGARWFVDETALREHIEGKQ
ncbi:helix-turn-helix domain-containing protein [Mycobacterium sp. 1164985.4]|uniref:helix-turn-helix domain-containing protein n=1 Tax=Mycobacterium sp. 1164985.4 TaxID=1834069 RepID=UPI0008018348|nr:helix-turn-helix domain-containing protein [Mycobacterium sp. 1164985.4]OBK75440.1 hypothetical protein A5650_17715 [Mycobacterium sp. 1164985.4]